MQEIKDRTTIMLTGLCSRWAASRRVTGRRACCLDLAAAPIAAGPGSPALPGAGFSIHLSADFSFHIFRCLRCIRFTAKPYPNPHRMCRRLKESRGHPSH